MIEKAREHPIRLLSKHRKGAGEIVDPAKLDLPTLIVVPENDRIVPPASARALIGAIKGARTLSPPAGHIGMVVGSKGRRHVWEPLAEWIAGLPS